MTAKKLKPITNKLLWIFAIGQFGWSLLSGIVSNWMVYYYTGSPDAQNPNTGIFASGITQNPIRPGAGGGTNLRRDHGSADCRLVGQKQL